MALSVNTVLLQILFLTAVATRSDLLHHTGCELADETNLVQVQKTVVPGNDRVLNKMETIPEPIDLDSESSTEEEIKGKSLEDLKGMMGQLVHGGAKRMNFKAGQIPDLSALTNAQALADAKKSTTCRMSVDDGMKRHVTCQYEMNTNQHDFNCELIRSGWLMALGYYDTQVASSMPGNAHMGDKVHVACENCWSGALPNCLNIETNEDAMLLVGSFMEPGDLPAVQEFWGNVKWDGPKPDIGGMAPDKGLKSLPGFNMGDMSGFGGLA